MKKSAFFYISIPKNTFKINNRQIEPLLVPDVLYADDIAKKFHSFKDIAKAFEVFKRFASFSGLNISPEKTKLTTNMDITDEVRLFLIQLGFLEKNINVIIEFLGYKMSLKTNEIDLASDALKVVSEKMRINMTRSKQLPFTIIGKEIFTRTYISSVAFYRLTCRDYPITKLKEIQKTLDDINFGKRSRYNGFAKYRSTTLGGGLSTYTLISCCTTAKILNRIGKKY